MADTSLMVTGEKGGERGRASFVTRDVPEQLTVIMEDSKPIIFDLTQFFLSTPARIDLFHDDDSFIDALLFALWISSHPRQRDLSTLPPASPDFPLVLHYRSLLPRLIPKLRQDGMFRSRLLTADGRSYSDLTSLSLCCARVQLHFFKYHNPVTTHDHLVLSVPASIVNHDCEPNTQRRTVVRTDDSASISMLVQTINIRPLRAGDELTLSYLNEEQLKLPVKQRRKQLVRGWGLRCQCGRCKREAASSTAG